MSALFASVSPVSRRSMMTRAHRAVSRSNAVFALALAATLAVPLCARADAPAPGATAAPKSTTATAKASRPASAWRELDPASCRVLQDGELARLPEAWRRYAAVAKRCDLTVPNQPTRVSLVSVFTLDYYEGKPADAAWEDFPKPLILDQDFRCLGVLREIYPVEQPRELTLRHGQWRDGWPQEIRVRVSNPALGGDYDLPPLRWDAAQQSYRSKGADASKDLPCPKS